MSGLLTVPFLLLCMLMLTLSGCGGGNSSTATGGGSVLGATLSGTIRVNATTARDNDVNDPNARFGGSNDDLQKAQPIPNPAIVGGYVNQPNTGSNGRSFVSGDINDIYLADLRAGQVIILFIADLGSGTDLDLILIDNNGIVRNASAGLGDTESLIVPENGRFFIQVNALRGASNYVLSLGQNISGAQIGESLRLSDSFASGEITLQVSDASAFNSLSALGLQTRNQTGRGSQLFTFDTAQLRSLSADSLQFASAAQRDKYQTLMMVKQLRQQAGIRSADPNYLFSAQTTPNDPYFRYQWNMPMISAPQAWDVTKGSGNVIVAVADSGVLLNHPDLRGKLVAGVDFVSDIRTALDGDGIDNNPDDPGDRSPGGSTFHGSHVAGIIGAATNNREGIAGVGWNTSIMPLRVLGLGGNGRDFDIEQAIRYAAGLPNQSGTVPPRRADILNLSLGGPSISSGLRQAVADAVNAGLIIVAAAGNDGSGVSIFPASLPGVISVSAVNIRHQRAAYSNFGPNVDVAAPGGEDTPDVNGDGIPDGIISTVGEDRSNFIQFGVATSNGTSMASPHVAGVIALMKAVNPSLTISAVESLISSGSIVDDLGTAGRDDSFGYGLINALKAVQAASRVNGQPQPSTVAPQLVSNLRGINFGLSDTETTLTLTNGGNGTLRLVGLSENSGGFLSLGALQVDSNGLGSYRVAVNRSGLGTGTYSALITVRSSVNTLQIPVIMQIAASGQTGDAGFHYVLLVAPDTLEARHEDRVNVSNGAYSYRFTSVAQGNYLIYAGTDMDNDSFICDLGEACAAYRIVDRPSPVNVSNSLSGLDFNTDFNVNFVVQSIDTQPVTNIGGIARPGRLRQVGHRGE